VDPSRTLPNREKALFEERETVTERSQILSPSQAASVQFVPVPPALLHDLRRHQSRLRGYVEGYIELREWSFRCQRLAATLRQRGRAEENAFWDAVETELDDGTRLEMLRRDFVDENHDAVQTFDTAFEAAKAKVDSALDEEDATKLRGLAAEVLRHVREMETIARDLAAASRRDARELLEQLGSCVDQIFVAVDHPSGQNALTEESPYEEKLLVRSDPRHSAEREPLRSPHGAPLKDQTRDARPSLMADVQGHRRFEPKDQEGDSP
jgi:hypothetical protein